MTILTQNLATTVISASAVSEMVIASKCGARFSAMYSGDRNGIGGGPSACLITRMRSAISTK